MKPQDGVSILDLGGESGEFLARIRSGLQGKFVIADIHEGHRSTVQQRYGFDFVLLAEDDPLPFEDKEFDIVINNSVIEHVTLPKRTCLTRVSQKDWVDRSLRRQQEFASEIRRVGKGYFVQTPHKNFPLETHTWLPFVNLLNHNQTVSLARFTDKFWIKHCGYVDWNLLGAAEMQALFPDATIHVERFLGLPKSIIAYST
ncbi:MAG TPA: methyltransferase domain-containing protein [Pyrinomonadaceae bacterium]|nr:methyltransferase domain-containing protein [Pyrinomonadaceae bacterium]